MLSVRISRFICLVMIFRFVASGYNPDRIISLPGVPQEPTFASYSGYLRVDDEKLLHYWLVSCEDPHSKNLIIWFNGGPGCSSMDGLFTENGPYKFNQHGQLTENPYSWHKLAHMLYIESPAGVGFSRAPNDAKVNDDTTADDATKALLDFYNKFPELSSADIYVSGESYAGFYVPILVTRMLTIQTFSRKIKGVMIGNPLLYQESNMNSFLYYSYYHGLFGETKWRVLIERCCGNNVEHVLDHTCRFYGSTLESCMVTVVQLVHSIYNSGLNIYNLYQDCAPPETIMSMQYYKEIVRQSLANDIEGKYFGKGKRKLVKWLKDKTLKMTPQCSNSSMVTGYLNRADVQRAIHVDNTHWEVCSGHIHDNFKKKYTEVRPFLEKILAPQNDIRVLLYFGDMDMACNHLGGEWIIDSLEKAVTLPRRPWSITKGHFDQVAGYVKIYDKLTFATVKGAGHMVPTDKPYESYVMVNRFLNYEPL